MQPVWKQFRTILLLSVLLGASTSYGAPLSGVDVTAKEKKSGKSVKHVATDQQGKFIIGGLGPGVYTVEFRIPKSDDLSRKQFSIAIAGGTQSARHASTSGEKLMSGKVAIDVEIGPGARISGQVTMQSAKKMVWVPAELGSNLPGHWVEEGAEDAASARNTRRMNKDDFQKTREHGDLSTRFSPGQ
jgi:hypothetical protein